MVFSNNNEATVVFKFIAKEHQEFQRSIQSIGDESFAYSVSGQDIGNEEGVIWRYRNILGLVLCNLTSPDKPDTKILATLANNIQERITNGA